jgi:hypothetical protein
MIYALEDRMLYYYILHIQLVMHRSLFAIEYSTDQKKIINELIDEPTKNQHKQFHKIAIRRDDDEAYAKGETIIKKMLKQSEISRKTFQSMDSVSC